MTIHETFRAKHPKAATLAERARAAIPGGITHDIRHLKPFAIYVDRASGARKWDGRRPGVHRLLDGPRRAVPRPLPPAVVTAVQAQVARGTHLGACHELEVRWAELVNHLVPCAELTRFTMSGTEATHLALRIARAFTGRPRILKFTGHFHGCTTVSRSASILRTTSRCPPACRRDARPGHHVPANDIKAVETILERGESRPSSSSRPAASRARRRPFPAIFRSCARRRSATACCSSSTRSSPASATRGRRQGILRRDAGHHDARQDRGRRPARRRRVRTARRHVDAGPSRRSQLGPQRARGPRGTFNANRCRRRRPSPRGAIARRRGRTSSGKSFAAGWDEAMKRAGAPGTCYGEASHLSTSRRGQAGPGRLRSPAQRRSPPPPTAGWR